MGFWSSTPATPPSGGDKSQNSSKAASDDEELANFLKQIEAEQKANEAPVRNTRDETGLDLSQFPDTMSCRIAFDQMFYCYSLGGQFLNVYRYGTLRDCSEISRNFRVCMKAKVRSKAESKRIIQEREKERALMRLQKPNCEDIWEVRKEPLKNPFSGSLDDLVEDALS